MTCTFCMTCTGADWLSANIPALTNAYTTLIKKQSALAKPIFLYDGHWCFLNVVKWRPAGRVSIDVHWRGIGFQPIFPL